MNTQFDDVPWGFQGTSKFNQFSMGTQFNGDTFENDLNGAFYQRRLKFSNLKEKIKSIIIKLPYTDYEEL